MQKSLVIIFSTIIIGLLLLLFTMIREFSPIDINLPIYLGLFICWLLFIGGILASITYLMEYKIRHYKITIMLVFIINIIVLGIIFIVPLSKIWEVKMLERRADYYMKVISLVLKEEIKPGPASIIHYPNKVTKSIIVLPNEFKYLSVTKDLEFYRWDNNSVICFTRDGFLGHNTGYCYSSNDQEPNKTYEAFNSNLHFSLRTLRNIKPHWYVCVLY